MLYTGAGALALPDNRFAYAATSVQEAERTTRAAASVGGIITLASTAG